MISATQRRLIWRSPVLPILLASGLALSNPGAAFGASPFACLRLALSNFVQNRLPPDNPQAKLDYRVQEPPLGAGYGGAVYKGTLPSDFPVSQDASGMAWVAGKTPVAVKIPRRGAVNLQGLAHEAQMSGQVAPWDPRGLFMRYRFDSRRNVLVSPYQEGWISLQQWASAGPSGISEDAAKKIADQLIDALAVLKEAKLVHSDLGPKNILIDPADRSIRIIDYGVMTEVGDYPGPRSDLAFNKRGGHLRSPNQQKDLPAQPSDDEYAVVQTLESLRPTGKWEEYVERRLRAQPQRRRP